MPMPSVLALRSSAFWLLLSVIAMCIHVTSSIVRPGARAHSPCKVGEAIELLLAPDRASSPVTRCPRPVGSPRSAICTSYPFRLFSIPLIEIFGLGQPRRYSKSA